MPSSFDSLDVSNLEFSKSIFPKDWQNPAPEEIYDLVVVGGGPGGMISAMYAKELGFKVALVEKQHLGGECLSAGCIPSKALLKCSRVLKDVLHAQEFGIEIPKGLSVDFGSVMARVRGIRNTIAPHDSPEHLKKLGIDVFLGSAKFTGANSLDVKGSTLRFKKGIIATGTHPVIPSIPGLEEAGYLTNQTVFNLTKLPKRFAFIGAGPIGCELAQAFAGFGSQVLLITDGSKILPREEPLASERLENIFKKEGIEILFNSQLSRVEKKDGKKVLFFEGTAEKIEVDEILIGIGRLPTVEGFGLELAGVAFDLRRGIQCDDLLLTTNPLIYSVGDVGSPQKFTHLSKEMARMAVENALNGGSYKKSELTLPWCTFTQPEIAHVGLYEREAKAQGIPTRSALIEMKDVDRAIIDGETEGFVKLLLREDSDQIIGATIVANQAGDMLGELTLAVAGKLPLSTLVKTIHPFPTQPEAIRMAFQKLKAPVLVASK